MFINKIFGELFFLSSSRHFGRVNLLLPPVLL